MNPKDRVTAYIALSRQLDQQYDRRRSLEWKIHIALWTLLAASGYAILTYAPSVNRTGLLVALTTVTFVHFVWAVKIHTGQFRDQNRSITYRDKAESILKSEPDDASVAPGARSGPSPFERTTMPSELQRLFESYWWWLFAEVGTTVLIAFAVYSLAASAEFRASATDVSAVKEQLVGARAELEQLRRRLESAETRIDRLQDARSSSVVGNAAAPRAQ